MLNVHDLWKTYAMGEHPVHALRGVTATVHAGEFALLLGPSGSGKSSRLHILGAMDHPSRGGVEFEGREISGLSTREQTRLRLTRIGFVFQTFNLMPTLSALENVALPMRLAGVGRRERLERALGQWMLGLHADTHGYTEVNPPLLVNAATPADIIPWTEILATSSATEFAAPAVGASANPTLSGGKVTNRTATWSFAYSNSAVPAPGTYTGQVTYTATMP